MEDIIVEKTDPDKTAEIEPVKTCRFQMSSVVVSGISRITTKCSACNGDVEGQLDVHSTSLIRKTVPKCPFCGAINEDYCDDRA